VVAGYAGATPLVAPLFLGPLDIAGDTHGEMEKRQSEAVLNWGRARDAVDMGQSCSLFDRTSYHWRGWVDGGEPTL